MSTERIVNRVHQPHVEAEAPVQEQPSSFDGKSPEFAEPGYATFETLEVTEEPNGNRSFPDSGLGVQDWSGQLGTFTTEKLLVLSLGEQEKFNKRVIAAFRHLGLDCRKFFEV